MTQRQVQGNTLLTVSDSTEKRHICPSAHTFWAEYYEGDTAQRPRKKCYFIRCILSL